MQVRVLPGSCCDAVTSGCVTSGARAPSKADARRAAVGAWRRRRRFAARVIPEGDPAKRSDGVSTPAPRPNRHGSKMAIGLPCRNGPMCTLSQNGYGDSLCSADDSRLCTDCSTLSSEAPCPSFRQLAAAWSHVACNDVCPETRFSRPRGPMDKASAYGAGDCRFESCRDHRLLIKSMSAFNLRVKFEGKNHDEVLT